METSIGKLPGEFDAAVEQQRIATLFVRFPASLISALVGILLTFVLLLPASHPDLIKAWAAFMLATLGLRGWAWYMFKNTNPDLIFSRRWEWMYACGMGLTGLGWALLNGPLYPTLPSLQGLVMMMTVFVALTGMIYSAVSRPAFLLFVLPTLLSAIARYVEASHASVESLFGATGCAIVTTVIYRSLNKFSVDQIRRQVESDALLAEQQAIFQSATMGIGVVRDERIVKCNQRLGEVFGHRLQQLQEMQLDGLFFDQAEYAEFRIEIKRCFEADQPVQTIRRMLRGDGSHFWAELSGRQMQGDSKGRSVWLVADVTMRVGTERQSG
jgi:PAS domain S-box-containing protein